jgi:hypothetical protein
MARTVEALERTHFVAILSLTAFLAGLGGALIFFWPRSPLARRQLIRPGTALGALNRALVNLWYVDRFYGAVFVGGLHVLRKAAGWFDLRVIDAIVNFQAVICRAITAVVGKVDAGGVDGAVRGLGEATLLGGRKIRKVQTGLVGQYVYASVFLLAGALAVSSWIIWMTVK